GAVRRQELLLRVILDRPHALLQRGILRGDAEDAAIDALLLLSVAIDQVVVVFVCQRPERPGLIRAMDALALLHVAPLLLGQRTVGTEVDAPGPAMVIVYRHPDMTAERVIAERRAPPPPRQQPLA